MSSGAVHRQPHRPLRILNVVGSLVMGGTERYLSRIIPILRRQHGIDVELCLLQATGPLLDVVKSDGVHILTTANRRRGGRIPIHAIPLTLLDMARLIRRGHYDVVHSYLFHAEVPATASAWLARTPRIIISRRALYPWRRPRGPIPYALETLTNVLADELIANSWTVMRDVERTERLLPRVRGVIYNGVDVSLYRLASPQKNGPLRMVTVGALADRKGQEYAISALRLVRDAGIDSELTIVGSGPNERRLRELAQKEGVTDQITFAGLVEDPRSFLEGADLFVLPSRQEGFSNALLEAMASGLPVVATDVGGNAEALEDGIGGFIVPPEDASALARAVAELGRTRERLTAMGAANRKRITERFSLEASAANLASWYRQDGAGASPRAASTPAARSAR
jgi:glycosyltransferase involved in cell wall biosynthesis